MTELPPETLAGVMQNVAAPRLQPSAAKGAQADIAFARALDFLRGRKEENRKEPGEQPPPGTALPQQAAPGPSSQLAMDKLIAAASKEDQPGDEPKADAKAECQAQNVLTTPPLFPLAICAPAFRESKSHCGGDPSTAPAKIDLQAGMIAASVSSPGRPDLKGQADRKATTAEEDRQANLRASYDDVALASAHSDVRTSGDIPLVASAVCAAKSGTQESAAEFTAPPIKIHVSEIETHLPFAIQNALPDRPHEVVKPETVIESRAVETAEQQQRAPVKILKFEMEPATLGGISVRMRVTHARVDIQITAENASTSVLLADTRDALGAAIGEKGFSLHSYEVVNSQSTPASPQNGQSQSNFNEQQRAYAGERGFAGDDRPNQRQRQAPNGDPRRRDETTAGVPSVDLVL
ncbi:hypothetical protein AMST5_03040 [freshwater sediment metagenome]|uniref:Flagellar hook-length control protein-like C-terminal domain-containing protein n=1 Tax=freshwater sediment metagenome TaxID=556182 RepID=A0AA48M3X0_9ZZZZ